MEQQHHRLTDFQGLKVTLFVEGEQSHEVVDCINQFCKGVLRYGRRWNVIERAVALDPSCVLALVFAADFEASKERVERAKEHLKRARHIVESQHNAVGEREKLYVEAFCSWMNGDLQQAFDVFKKITELFPSDLVALKRGQLVAFCMGDLKAILSIALGVENVCKDREYYGGMLCFALEQNGRYEEALIAGKKGVSILEDDPWAHHSVAHALLSLGKVDEGIEWMKKYSHYWESCMSFMHVHNWFHLALFYLSKGAHDEIEAIYYPHIFLTDQDQQRVDEERDKKDDSFPVHDNRNTQDQLGAMGLLWKWELKGGKNLEAKWAQLLPYVEHRRNERVDPFYDVLLLHTLLRMAGKKEEAKEMVKGIEQSTAGMQAPRKEQLETVWVPLCQGIYEFFAGKREKGLELLHKTPVDHLNFLGASNEQREVIHDFLASTRKASS